MIVVPDTKSMCCLWFGNLNIITGEKMYTACRIARQDVDKCGINANFFCNQYTHETIDDTSDETVDDTSDETIDGTCDETIDGT